MNLKGKAAMNILDIDHIELYVGDAIAAAQSLCTAYGFRVYGHGGPDTGLPEQRSVLLGQGDIRVLLTSGLHEDHPASQFVARHGDGVAVIAFRTDSAAIAYTDAVAARRVGHPPAPHLGERRGQRGHRGGRRLRRRGLPPGRTPWLGRPVPARRDRDGARRGRRSGRRPAAHHRPRGGVRAGRRTRPHHCLPRAGVRLHGHLPGVHRDRRAGHDVQGRAEPVRRRDIHDPPAGPHPPGGPDRRLPGLARRRRGAARRVPDQGHRACGPDLHRPRRRVRGDAVELLRHAGRAPGRDRHRSRRAAAARHPGRPRPLGPDVPDLREVDAHQAHVSSSS